MYHWKLFTDTNYQWNPWGSACRSSEPRIQYFERPVLPLQTSNISFACRDTLQMWQVPKGLKRIEYIHNRLRFSPESENVPMETEIQSELIMVLFTCWTSPQSCHPNRHFMCRVATLRFGLWTTWLEIFLISLKLLIAKTLCQYITFNV